MSLTKVSYSLIQGSTFNVKDYGAKGDGVTDDTSAIQAAAAALQANGGGTLYFPVGTYSVFGSTTGYLCSFSGINGISCIGYGATIAVPASKTITAAEGAFFSFSNCKNIVVDGFQTDGPTLDVSTTVKGYIFVSCTSGCRNICMPNNRVKNSLAGLIVSKAFSDPESDRTQNIYIGVLDIKNCWYGINGQYSGDFMHVECLRTDTIHRSFFIYGASNIKANIWSKDHKAVDVPIATLNGTTVQNIDINYYSGTDSVNCGHASKVQLSFSNETASVLRNIRVNLNVAYNSSGDTGGAALYIVKFNNSVNPDPSDRGHIFDTLVVSGTITGTASYFNNDGAIATSPDATWGTGDYFRNISFENLRITGANSNSQVNLVFGNVQDNILFKNVYSNYDILVKNSATATRLPYVATTEFINTKCLNLTAINGLAQPLTILRAVSSPDTVQTGWSGKTIGNLGVSGTVTWNLPAAVPGLTYRFVRNNNQAIELDPNGSEVIRGGTAGQKLVMNSDGNQVVLACYIAGTWEVESAQGSYTFS